MQNIDGDFLSVIVAGMLFFALIVCTLGYFWFVLRASAKATEVLRIYAERGEEPPQSVVDAFERMTGTGKSEPDEPPPTRGQHLSQFASSTVIAIGSAGVAWWQAPETGEEPGGVMMLAVVVAVIATASAVWRLVAALHTRDGQ